MFALRRAGRTAARGARVRGFASRPAVTTVFDRRTSTAQYVVACTETKRCAIIDPVWDYDAASGKLCPVQADRLCDLVRNERLDLQWILDTHAHADHMTGSALLKERYQDATYAMGRGITQVQQTFAPLFSWRPEGELGSQFDHLFEDGEEFQVGELKGKAIHTPGHTPDSMSYLIGDCLFTGDALFMPDMGTGRCDFPAGSAEVLYNSIQKIHSLPPNTRIFVGHDYSPNGRAVQTETTVGESRRENVHVRVGTTLEQFKAYREMRDRELAAPKLIWPSGDYRGGVQAGERPRAGGDHSGAVQGLPGDAGQGAVGPEAHLAELAGEHQSRKAAGGRRRREGLLEDPGEICLVRHFQQKPQRRRCFRYTAVRPVGLDEPPPPRHQGGRGRVARRVPPRPAPLLPAESGPPRPLPHGMPALARVGAASLLLGAAGEG
eukprot:CAMPEP_0204304252 /NCGR_PEP_ID=MMETSP0468-20130131/84318_1 /ASSEMBLY_ACC=CAM_ASM_000383 /TAXON_ID=2969 /ORGANISM="Oxyrrhis marina" /LENGTH=435 /DNA_ID=CAMNT_0051283575 /DNA_START=28 /DNA_END=1335 /DNA_ORIENTATION=-